MSAMEENKNYVIQDEGLGEVKIADDVISVIAGLAIQDIEGVEGTSASMPSELAKKFGFKMTGQGIKTTLIDGEVEIDISLVLKYGYNIMDVSSKVQEKIKNAVSNMTGFEVVSVNVKVAGIDVE